MDPNMIPNPYGQYQNGNPVPYRRQPLRPQKPIGFAVTALILGIVSLLGICCCVNLVTAPLAIIFGIIALVQKQRGTGMSITGIITAALSLIAALICGIAFAELIPYAEDITADYERIIVEADEIFPEYEETGELPDFLTKYLEEPYAGWLAKYDIDFYDIMDVWLIEYKNGTFGLQSSEDSDRFSYGDSYNNHYDFDYGGNGII